MTKDFKSMRKWTEDDETGLESLMLKFIGAFFLFCAAAIVYSILSIPEAKAENMPVVYSNPCITEDCLISPQMVMYIEKYGRHADFSEMDMQ